MPSSAPQLFRQQVLALVRAAVGDPAANFRDEDQFQAINHLVNTKSPLLVVERTGWGKSLVYFIAAKLLRAERGNSGPALLVTPLLALMRNQLQAAYITCVPSLGQPTLVPSLALRIATATKLPFYEVIRKVKNTSAQKEMRNSLQQVQNLDGAFAIALPPNLIGKSLLLLDDISNSGWTFTVLTALLRQRGAGSIYPVVSAISRVHSPR